MYKKLKNKIPIFLRTHPLMLESYLETFDYSPLFFAKGITEIEKRTVVILLSLFELEPFIGILRKRNINMLRFVVFSSVNELNFFRGMAPLFDIRGRRRIGIFIPHRINVNDPQMGLSLYSIGTKNNPIIELNQAINLSLSLSEL